MPNFVNPFPQFCNQNGTPYSGGRVSFYDSGTTTLSEVFADKAFNTQIDARQILGADGRLLQAVYLPSKDYYITLEPSDLSGGFLPIVVDIDPYVVDSESTGSTGILLIVDTIQDMISLGTSSYPVKVLGYVQSYDGGGGLFHWNADQTILEDGGMYFGSGASGRWQRTIEGDCITSAMFGMFGSNNMSSVIMTACDYCTQSYAQAKRFVILGGTYKLTSDTTIPAGMSIDVSCCNFYNTSGTEIDLVFNCDSVDYSYRTGKPLTTKDINLIYCPIDKKPIDIRAYGYGDTYDTNNKLMFEKLAYATTIGSGHAGAFLSTAISATFDTSSTIEIELPIIFRAGAQTTFTNAGTGGTVHFTNLYAETDKTVFNSLPTNMYYSGNIPATIFIGDGTLVQGYFESVCSRCTFDFSKPVNMYWSAFKKTDISSWDQTPIQIIDYCSTKSNAQWITHHFDGSLLIKSHVSSALSPYFGYVTAGEYQVFVSPSALCVLNTRQPIVWFGTRDASTYAATNNISIEYAINSAAMAGGYVDLCGRLLTVGRYGSLGGLDTTISIDIRNGSLHITQPQENSFPLFDDKDINLDGVIITTDGESVANNPIILTGTTSKTSFTARDTSITTSSYFDNCSTGGYKHISFDNCRIECSGGNLRSNTYNITNTKIFSYERNASTKMYLRMLGDYSEGLIDYKGSLQISGGEFDQIEIYDPENVSISGSVHYGSVTINGVSPSTIASNVKIGGVFVGGDVIAGANLATSGHIDCFVDATGTTKSIVEYSYTPLATSAEVSLTVDRCALANGVQPKQVLVSSSGVYDGVLHGTKPQKLLEYYWYTTDIASDSITLYYNLAGSPVADDSLKITIIWN